MELYDWQVPLMERTADALAKYRVCVDAFTTGAGKTPIAVATVRKLGLPYLVIAPKVALTQWRRTAEAMGYAGRMVGCVNPERISMLRGCEFYCRTDPSPWKIAAGTAVIWDEPHRSASGVDSQATLAMARLRAYKDSRLLALSATIADSPLKLRALGYWMGFHSFQKASFYDWCRKNGCRTVEFGWGRNRRSAFEFTKSRVEAEVFMKRIRDAMGERMLSLGPDEIPGFPDETVETLCLDLEKTDHDGVVEAYAEMTPRMKSKTQSDVAEVTRQRERAEFCKAGAMAERAVSYEADGFSPVLFFNFTSARERAESALRESKVAFASVYGGQKDRERQDGIDAFQRNDVHVLVCMSAAAACAMSAHDEHHERPRVSFISPGFNAADMKQALGRIRRCNGTKATQFFVLAANTVEERVAKTLERKLRNIDTINDGDLMPPEEGT